MSKHIVYVVTDVDDERCDPFVFIFSNKDAANNKFIELAKDIDEEFEDEPPYGWLENGDRYMSYDGMGFHSVKLSKEIVQDTYELHEKEKGRKSTKCSD